MYLSAFFAPAVILVSISGGLYLIGIKGNVEEEVIYRGEEIMIDVNSASLKADVSALLTDAGVGSYEFEYVREILHQGLSPEGGPPNPGSHKYNFNFLSIRVGLSGQGWSHKASSHEGSCCAQKRPAVKCHNKFLLIFDEIEFNP